MKLKELYSVLCIVFASNFKRVISEDNLRKMQKNWIITNETDENKKGHDEWHLALTESISDIEADFKELSSSFDMAFFKLISETDVTLFYEKLRFQKPFNELPSSHSANMLGLLSAILKHDEDEKTHNLLGLYLTNYLIFSARALASHLQINAKSHYYKAMGYFLADFCNMIKITTGLKA